VTGAADEAVAEPVEHEEDELVVAELEPVIENHVAVEVDEVVIDEVVDEEPADEEPADDEPVEADAPEAEPVEAAAANGEWTYTPMSDWGLDDRR
jgi:hypothetical protein